MIDKKTEKKLGLKALDSVVTNHPLSNAERAAYHAEKVKELSALIDKKDERIAGLVEEIAYLRSRVYRGLDK